MLSIPCTYSIENICFYGKNCSIKGQIHLFNKVGETDPEWEAFVSVPSELADAVISFAKEEFEKTIEKLSKSEEKRDEKDNE
jgi:hypothetical protein